jgi:starch synthase (maltosyl-transferring)
MSSYQTRTDSQPGSPNRRLSHILIEDVTPSVDGGRYPAKRTAGEPCVVEADIFRDGHQVLRAAVKWRRKQDEVFDEAPMAALDNDRWRGEFIPTDNTRYVFTIEAWTDLFASWLADFTKKVKAARPVASDILEGTALVEKMLSSARGADRDLLERVLARLRKTNDGATALAIITEAEISTVAERVGERFGLTRFEPALELVVDRERARYGTWYEMFVRSQSSVPGKAGTFQDAERRLPELRDLGFDVVYLPPIHPIGHTNRKGPGNSLNGGSNSPGSPWAIGSEAGGHTAIEPSIGTLGDFDRFNAAANRLGNGGGARFRDPVLARPSMGPRASGLVSSSP